MRGTQSSLQSWGAGGGGWPSGSEKGPAFPRPVILPARMPVSSGAPASPTAGPPGRPVQTEHRVSGVRQRSEPQLRPHVGLQVWTDCGDSLQKPTRLRTPGSTWPALGSSPSPPRGHWVGLAGWPLPSKPARVAPAEGLEEGPLSRPVLAALPVQKAAPPTLVAAGARAGVGHHVWPVVSGMHCF